MSTQTNFKKQWWQQLSNFLAFYIGPLVLCLAAAQSPAQSYRVLHTFTGSDGANPQTSLVLSGTNLYGTTSSGGISNSGTLFKINTDGSDFTILKQFDGVNDGGYPLGGLLADGATLYGTTYSGGPGMIAGAGGGVVFKMNTDGTGYTVIHAFTYLSEAFLPAAGLVLSGTTLYGTTEVGLSNYGAVFKVNIDGSGYQLLKVFGDADGANPRARLILSGATLYGTTSGNALPAATGGTVFKVNTDGSGFVVLKELQRIGSFNRMFSPLVLLGTTLYGTACEDYLYGTVFAIGTDGGNYTVLRSITNSFGDWDWPGLAGPVLSGSTLYGTMDGGDPHEIAITNHGAVFQINTDGSGFRILKYFGGSEGENPRGELTVGGIGLYGTTARGGISNNGVVFALSLAPPEIKTTPQSQTAEAGTTVNFWVDAGDDPSLRYEWLFDNGTNVISCGTNCSLELTNVDFARSGKYTVLVTNVYGAVTSSPAALQVIASVERRAVPAIQVTGETGSVMGVDYCDSLSPGATWETMATMTLSATPQYYFDISTPLPPQRFYRVWQTGTPSVLPDLSFPSMVPALTLTGAIGDKVRVDAINQFGSTDAWYTQDTVALTNTTQLYFDTTAIGQPLRLYRLVTVP